MSSGVGMCGETPNTPAVFVFFFVVVVGCVAVRAQVFSGREGNE